VFAIFLLVVRPFGPITAVLDTALIFSNRPTIKEDRRSTHETSLASRESARDVLRLLLGAGTKGGRGLPPRTLFLPLLRRPLQFRLARQDFSALLSAFSWASRFPNRHWTTSTVVLPIHRITVLVLVAPHS